VFHLQADLLRKLDFRHQNITGPVGKLRTFRLIEVHVLTRNGAGIDSFVVNQKLVPGKA